MANQGGNKTRSTTTKSTAAKKTTGGRGSSTAGKTKTAGGSRTTGQKGTTGRTKGASMTGRQKEQEPAKERMSASMRDEIILAVTLLVSILFFLSYIHLCGTVGDWLNYVVFGLFGIFAYLFPFALFLTVAFSISNKHNRLAKRRIVTIAGFFICVASLYELANGFDPEVKWHEYFKLSAASHNGGGLLGGTPVKLLCPLFDTVATAVILVIVMLICLMLLTGKELFAYIQKATGERIREHRASYEEREELRLQRELEAYEEGEEPIRRARVITFPKKNAAKDEQTVQETKAEKPEKEKPLSFVDSLKWRGKFENGSVEEKTDVMQMEESAGVSGNGETTAVENEAVTDTKERHFYNTVVEMQEITTSEIKRASDGRVYEDELRRKFGNTESQSEQVEAVQPKITIHTAECIERETTPRIEIQTDSVINEEPMVQSVAEVYEQPEVVQEFTAPERSVAPAEKAVPDKPVAKSAVSDNGENGVAADIATQIEQTTVEKKYEFPPLSLLAPPPPGKAKNEQALRETAMKLQSTLESFGVRVTVTNISCGPSVTQYELQLEQGVKVSQITKLSDDIKLNMAAADIRIEAPIPGKAAVGIEIPNKENSMVALRELLESTEFTEHKSKLAFAVGKNISGQTIVSDIAKMPHMLIAGATGSGKSVCINTIIMSILYKADPADVKLIMVDPKVVELSVYNGIPHLLIPVVTDPKKASAALNWAVAEMTDRYNKFAQLGVRDLKGYNERVEKAKAENLEDPKYPKLPQIVIIVDELADLMMVASGEVEDAICRLAQMARAAGLHLIIATQRPSVNVITGLIKANVPSRIAFAVTSVVDSRTILDGGGAEKLLGKGDMLFFPSGYPKPVRIQGAFVSDAEVSAVVDFLKEQAEGAGYSEEVSQQITTAAASGEAASGSTGGSDKDDYFVEAGRFIIEKEKASIGMLQRVYKIGFNRAARIMDQLTAAGVVGPEEGTKPRKILMTMEEFEQYIEQKG